ncbi:BAG family molecular chaperone regulator 6 [Hirschfeldia incana]|nr:BAG family molecular chaperone regulator 6 [Hirschfeldia incana]
MMPMYMNSPQPGQMRPQGGCYHQGFGNYPHHAAVDASSPGQCEHWPSPSPCYGGCVHGNIPTYAPYWSPTPCYPPQTPYHTCCGNHLGFYPHAPPCYIHHPFPVGYQQGFESEKDVTGKNRCAKCSSSRMCSPKNGSGVVIEEHEPEIEKGDRGEDVNHVRSTNYPYPIVWIPHENARNQEHGSHNQPPAHVKAPETENKKVQKGDPKYLNGSFPFDDNTIKSWLQNQDRNKRQNGKSVELPFDISKLKSLLQGQGQSQNSKEPGQLQYPIFWIPSQGKHEDVEASERKERGKEGSDLKSLSSDHLNEGQISQGNFEGNDAEEKNLVRNIPVESHKEPRNIPVKLSESHLPEPTEKIVKTEPAENTRKEQRSSPPKASRLPPVCLRVDPLPKSKNGKSKSLSPPRRKEQTLTSEETRVGSPLSSKKVDARTTPESSNIKCEEKTPVECPKPLVTEKESVSTKSDLQGVECEIVKPCEAKENEEEPAKKAFTEEEAATIIQSRYRGYDVRRWEPIKKLKEIATVREQMGDVKKRVQALELSTGQQAEGKEAVVLGEMVMSLLLKLDSVQGLHPSIRDHRKSLARELSDMQENIDSLKKSSVEKGAVEESTSQTSESPVSLEHSQHAEEKNMVSDSNTEKVCLPSPEEHLTSPRNTIEGQLVAEAEEITALSETLATDAEPAAETVICEADSTTIPQKIEANEAVLPVDPSSGDGNEMTVTNKEDKVIVENLEEPLPELPQVVEIGSENATEVSETVANESENEDRKGDDDDSVLSSEKIEAVENQSSADGNDMTMTNIDEDKVMVVKLEELQVVETTHGQAFEGVENATEVSDTVANVSETEDRKGDDDCVLPSEKDAELSELPAGVIDDDKMQLLSQDSLSSPGEEKTVVDPEIASKEETNVDHSSTGIGQETERGMSEETKKLMEENQRFKETMETLLKAGREQLEVISKLTGRVKSLEKKLSQKKRTRIGRGKPNRGKQTTKPMPASCTDALM